MSLFLPQELPYRPIPDRFTQAIAADAALPICDNCGTQYTTKPEGDCSICSDDREFVRASGQEWTTLGELSESRTHSLMVDTEDPRIAFIQCKPAFAIDQTPFLLNTSGGHYIWDCQAPFTPALGTYLSSLEPALKAIVISHPHFFSTSLTWSRALHVPLYVCETDREWYQRRGEIGPDDEVKWWTGRREIGPGVTVVQCGGHFPGSSVLHWDRSLEPGDGPKTGVLLTADTMMVCMDRKGFTFMWSYPNMTPLRPKDAVEVVKAVDEFEFEVASSSWPNTMIRCDAKRLMHMSLERYLDATGWRREGGEMRPRVSA